MDRVVLLSATDDERRSSHKVQLDAEPVGDPGGKVERRVRATDLDGRNMRAGNTYRIREHLLGDTNVVRVSTHRRANVRRRGEIMRIVKQARLIWHLPGLSRWGDRAGRSAASRRILSLATGGLVSLIATVVRLIATVCQPETQDRHSYA